MTTFASLHPRETHSGKFTDKANSESETTLPAPTVGALAEQEPFDAVETDWDVIDTIDHAGGLLSISTDREGNYQAWSEPVVAYFFAKDVDDITAVVELAPLRFDEAWRDHLIEKRSALPESAAASIEAEIRRVVNRIDEHLEEIKYTLDRRKEVWDNDEVTLALDPSDQSPFNHVRMGRSTKSLGDFTVYGEVTDLDFVHMTCRTFDRDPDDVEDRAWAVTWLNNHDTELHTFYGERGVEVGGYEHDSSALSVPLESSGDSPLTLENILHEFAGNPQATLIGEAVSNPDGDLYRQLRQKFNPAG